MVAYKIGFLIDRTNNWIEKFLRKETFKNSTKYKFKIFTNYIKIKNYDVVFILGYTRILDKNFLNKNKYNLVVHESNLPKGKGFAPIQWQILKSKQKIDVCLIQAENQADSGEIFKKTFINLNGSELYDEIREKQAKATFSIIKEFLKEFPKISPKKQIGKSTFYSRRYHTDHLLDINKSIKNNFNLLRIGNNEQFPSFFYYKSKKYILKIYKESKLKSSQLKLIKIKVCKLNDVNLLLKIHNAAVKGGYFSSKNLIKYPEHIKWLKNILKSNNSKIYIGYLNKKRFGYVRFDKIKNNVFEISIGNDPKFYNKGLGTVMLGLSMKKFIKTYRPKKIVCVIKKNNIRSQKCFLKNNLKLVKFNSKKHTTRHSVTPNKINTKKENYYEYNITT